MKIVANRKSLLAAMTIAASVAPIRGPKEILANALISAGHRCTVTATDYDIVAQSGFAADVDQPGSVIAPAALLRSMLRELSDEAVRLDVSKNTLLIRGQSTEHKLTTASPDGFPAAPVPKWDATAAVSMSAFARGVRAVIGQHGEDESRDYMFQSVFVEFGSGTIALVAADGRRCGSVEFPAASEETAKALIQPKAAKLMAGLSCEAEAKLSIEKNWFGLECGESLILSRLVEGKFPDWRKYAPRRTGARTSFSVPPSSLIACIRRACVAPPDEAQGPKAILVTSDGSLSVSCIASGGVASESTMPCDFKGEPMKVTLNWRFLLDALAGISQLSDLPVDVFQEGQGKPLAFAGDQANFFVAPFKDF